MTILPEAKLDVLLARHAVVEAELSGFRKTVHENVKVDVNTTVRVDLSLQVGTVTEAVTVVQVPGAFELPLGAMALAKTRRYACIVALGCVIRGETPHFDYVAGEAASGLQLAALETGIPVSFGVLTLDSPGQADERVDKGAEAVRTALEMADLFSQLRASANA